MPRRVRRANTETFSHTISGLLTKRADLCGEANGLREQLESVETDIATVDRVLRLLGYRGELDAVLPPRVFDAPYRRGEVMRSILDCLRQAGGPLPVQDIAETAFPEVDPAADPAQAENLRRRVSKALQRLKRDGAVECAKVEAGGAVWSPATT